MSSLTLKLTDTSWQGWSCPPTLFPTPPQFDWVESLLPGGATATHALQPCRPYLDYLNHAASALSSPTFLLTRNNRTIYTRQST